jgi:hypothetical protein|nr:MAG TPA: hypothetical protein [Caudoviricetes sp.]
MKFKSNARWNEPKESGTFFGLENNGLGVKIHRIIYIQDTWFLSCHALNISQMDLRESDFDKAVEKAKTVIENEIQELKQEYDKISGDDNIEIV